MLDAVEVEMPALPDVVPIHSPTLPAAALLPFVTPTMLGVVIVGELEVTALAKTNAVVASWVVLVPKVAVGAAGTPVKVGEASWA